MFVHISGSFCIRTAEGHEMFSLMLDSTYLSTIFIKYDVMASGQ